MGLVGYTAVAALVAVAVATRVPRGAVVGVMIASCVFWPEYLRIPIGLAQMSIIRFIALAVVARAFARGDMPRPYYPDFLVLALWAWGTMCSFLNGEVAGSMSYRAGVFLDSFAIYWAARICVRNGDDLVAAARWLCIAGAASAVMGVLEATWLWYPYRGWIKTVVAKSPFFANYADTPELIAAFPFREERMGLVRSYGSALTHIGWGTINIVMLGLLIPVLQDLRDWGKWPRAAWLGIGGVAVGLFCSLSAGPWAGGIILLSILALRPWTFLFPAMVGGGVATMLVVSLATGTAPWYPAFRMIGMDENTSWYRSELLTYVFTKVGDYGVMGAHADVFNGWARELDGRGYLDVANHYLMVGINAGVLGILLQLLIFAAVLAHLTWLFRTGGARTRRYAYGLGALVVSLAANAVSVTYSDVMQVMMYVMLGTCLMEPTPEEEPPDLFGRSRAPAWRGAADAADAPDEAYAPPRVNGWA